MSTVNTIRGPLDSSALGAALSHEHVAPGAAGMERVPGLYDEQVALAANLEALRRARAVGIDSMVDLTPLDLGRQVSLFQRIAEADPGVNIVPATGVYRWVPLYWSGADVDAVAEFFLREIQDGIEGTSIKAGVIKLAWDLEYRLDEGGPASPRGQLEKTARAAARASRAGGVPISCHTRAADGLGTPLLDIFEDEGLDLRAVTIGHTNDSDDIDYVAGVAKRGATVGLDRFSAARGAEELARRSWRGAAPSRYRWCRPASGSRPPSGMTASRSATSAGMRRRTTTAGCPSPPSRCRGCATTARARPTSTPCSRHRSAKRSRLRPPRRRHSAQLSAAHPSTRPNDERERSLGPTLYGAW